MNERAYFQGKFVELIKSRLNEEQNLSQELQDILHNSRDGAYRRIRCSTPFTLEEVVKLALHFQLSVDDVFKNISNQFQFDFFSYDFLPELHLYFEEIIEDLRNMKNRTNLKMIYATKDIPMFHFFNFPDLAAFKMFFWEKTIYDQPEYKDLTFQLDLIDRSIIEQGIELMQQYYDISSIEIWWDEGIKSTIKPIIYYSETKVIQDMALYLLSQVEKLVLHLQDIAAKGRKFCLGAEELPEQYNMKLYLDEITLPDNTILVTSEEKSTVYLIQNTIDYLVTSNTEFCEHTQRAMDNLMRKSALISIDNEKQRKKFFFDMVKEVELAKERIETLY